MLLLVKQYVQNIQIKYDCDVDALQTECEGGGVPDFKNRRKKQKTNQPPTTQKEERHWQMSTSLLQSPASFHFLASPSASLNLWRLCCLLHSLWCSAGTRGVCARHLCGAPPCGCGHGGRHSGPRAQGIFLGGVSTLCVSESSVSCLERPRPAPLRWLWCWVEDKDQGWGFRTSSGQAASSTWEADPPGAERSIL